MLVDLVADIGGTNARFAHVQDGVVCNVRTLQVADHPDVASAIHAYLAELGHAGLARVCMAVAGPVVQQQANLTNAHWLFNSTTLREHLVAQDVHLLNDWEAVAWALTNPATCAVEHLKGGEHNLARSGPKVLIGPGTGLGVAHLIPHGDAWVVVSGEGGHISWSPIGQRQLEVAKRMYDCWDHVSYERVASGQGLVNLYQALADVHGVPRRQLDAAAVVRMGLTGEDACCQEALALFHHALGALAGSLALTCTAGAVCLAGGIVQRLGADFLLDEFWQGFTQKGRSSALLMDTPVFRIQAAEPGLLGCAAWLAQSALTPMAVA